MKHIEQVIILGAGASTSDGMPIQSELFKEFFKKRLKFEAEKKSNSKLIHLLNGQEELIKKFFDDFWGIDTKSFKTKTEFPTFEECLGMLDIANIQRQSFKEYDQEMINKIRNALIFLISNLLDDKEFKNLELYLFCWDEVPGKDKGRRLISFLKQNFDINLAKTAQIRKIDSTTIKIFDEKNNHLLKLNDRNSEFNMKFDDIRIDEFIVKKENGKLNIYKELNHKKLIERLIAENKLKETAFISLNYDILIDNAITCPEFNADYGIEFINHKRPQDAEKSILLLKPHGSLNWLYCPTCNHIELFPKENRLIDLFLDISDHKDVLEIISCKNCGTTMKDVIVPMTYFKEMSNPFIQQILLKSDEILRHASKIIICGYSFPDADIHIKYLLKRAERFNGKTPEIFVVNNHKGKKLRQKKDEEQRFTRFFKNKNKIHYTDKSFEDFVKEGI